MEIINCYKWGKEKLLEFKPLKFIFNKYKNYKYRKWAYENFELDNPPLFGHIQIETTNWCNNNCPFCPVNCLSNKRGDHKVMSMQLIRKIAKELESLKFNGKISLYNNNEPLLDKRLPSIIKLFKTFTPEAKIVVMTNGLLLNTKKLIEFSKAGLDVLIIDNYDDNLKLIAPVQKVVDELNRDKIDLGDMNFRILLRKKNEILDNRAGNAPNKKICPKRYKKAFCILPFVQFNINPLGQVTICCYDTYYENIMGDINKDKILDIWHNARYRKIREALLKSRESLCPCNKCDYGGVYGVREGFLKITFSVKDNKIVWMKVPHIGKNKK